MIAFFPSFLRKTFTSHLLLRALVHYLIKFSQQTFMDGAFETSGYRDQGIWGLKKLRNMFMVPQLMRDRAELEFKSSLSTAKSIINSNPRCFPDPHSQGDHTVWFASESHFQLLSWHNYLPFHRTNLLTPPGCAKSTSSSVFPHYLIFSSKFIPLQWKEPACLWQKSEKSLLILHHPSRPKS